MGQGGYLQYTSLHPAAQTFPGAKYFSLSWSYCTNNDGLAVNTSETAAFFFISDTHLGPSSDFQLYGKNTYAWVERAVGAMNAFNGRVDFVVHGGDIVNRVYAESLALARQVFAPLRYPAYYITGNHDTATAVRSLMAGRRDIAVLGAGDGACYCFTASHCQCLALDTRGPDTIDPHGVFDDSRNEILARFLAEAGEAPVLIFLHFPPLPLDSKWHDRDMLLINGERLHQTLLRSGVRILGVFFGHVHRHLTVVQDGILYAGAPSLFCQFGASPNDASPRFEPDAAPGLLYVTVRGAQTLVREFRLGEGDFA